MSGHVIISFVNMGVVSLPFWHHGIEMRLHVCSNRRIGILIQGQAGRGVQDKDLKHPRIQRLKFLKGGSDFTCDQMKSS